MVENTVFPVPIGDSCCRQRVYSGVSTIGWSQLVEESGLFRSTVAHILWLLFELGETALSLPNIGH